MHTGVDLGHFVGVGRVFVAEAETLCYPMDFEVEIFGVCDCQILA